jgi:hypothetical protein
MYIKHDMLTVGQVKFPVNFFLIPFLICIYVHMTCLLTGTVHTVKTFLNMYICPSKNSLHCKKYKKQFNVPKIVQGQYTQLMQDMICLGSQEDPALQVSIVFKTWYAYRENIKLTICIKLWVCFFDFSLCHTWSCWAWMCLSLIR